MAEVRWGQASGPATTYLARPCPGPLLPAGSHPRPSSMACPPTPLFLSLSPNSTLSFLEWGATAQHCLLLHSLLFGPELGFS